MNILDRSTFDRICGDLPVEPVRKDIRAYASNEHLPIVGRVTTKVTARSNTTFAQVYVVDGRHGCLLGYETSTELGLIHVANAVTKNIITNAIPKAITLEEVEKATLEDTTLQRVMKLTRDGRWPNMQKSDDSSFRSFFNIRNELTIAPNEKVLMRCTRIVMPTILQDRAVNLAHEGHQGITKTKSLLREKVWFPGIDKMTEAAIKRCVPCRAAIPQTTYEPLKMTPLPETPWCELSTDFYGPLPSGEYLLVIIDDYSRFPVVELVRSTSANTGIPVLDKVLSTFGTPDILKSDNGAPFNSGQFHSYAENNIGPVQMAKQNDS